MTEIPEDLAQKRAKQAARAAKKEQAKEQGETSAKPKKVNTAAKAKKIKKQLEGLDKAQQMMTDLLSHGLGTLAGTSVKTYQALAKDLGSYYLTGAQIAFLRLAKEVEDIQKQIFADYKRSILNLDFSNMSVTKMLQIKNNGDFNG